MEIGQRLRRLRMAAGFSQRTLARKAGISQSALSCIEAGIQNPSVKTLSQICDALHIPLTVLLDPGLRDLPAGIPPHLESLVRQAQSLTAEQASLLAAFIASMKKEREPF